MLAAIFDQMIGIDDRIIGIGIFHRDLTIIFHLVALIIIKRLPDQIFGKIGGGCNADQPRNPVGPCQRDIQHDPAPK